MRLKKDTPNPVSDEKEFITVGYRGCPCVYDYYQFEEKSPNYPRPKDLRFDGKCEKCNEDDECKAAAAVAAAEEAAEEAARRRRAGLIGRLREMVRGRKARLP